MQTTLTPSCVASHALLSSRQSTAWMVRRSTGTAFVLAVAHFKEISSIASDTMELISSVTYFPKKQQKVGVTCLKMCNAAASEPAGSAAPGHTTFPKFKIQENDLLLSSYYLRTSYLLTYYSTCLQPHGDVAYAYFVFCSSPLSATK
jgi:hypothetical protein